jgi:hypothetical protein
MFLGLLEMVGVPQVKINQPQLGSHFSVRISSQVLDDGLKKQNGIVDVRVIEGFLSQSPKVVGQLFRRVLHFGGFLGTSYFMYNLQKVQLQIQ